MNIDFGIKTLKLQIEIGIKTIKNEDLIFLYLLMF